MLKRSFVYLFALLLLALATVSAGQGTMAENSKGSTASNEMIFEDDLFGDGRVSWLLKMHPSGALWRGSRPGASRSAKEVEAFFADD